MHEPSQSKEQIRKALKTISSRPPRIDPNDSGHYAFLSESTKNDSNESVMIPLLIGLSAVILSLIMLALRLHWI